MLINTKMMLLLRPLKSRLVTMVPPVDQSKVVGYTVHAKAIHVMAEAECKRLYGSQKTVKMVEGFTVNVEQQITKQRRKQFYIIVN